MTDFISNSDSLPAWEHFTPGRKEEKGTVSGDNPLTNYRIIFIPTSGDKKVKTQFFATSGAAKPGLSCGCSRLSRLCRLIFSCVFKN